MIKPTSLSAPRTDSIDIIDLKPIKIIIGINPMSLSAPWADFLDIIAMKPVKKK